VIGIKLEREAMFAHKAARPPLLHMAGTYACEAKERIIRHRISIRVGHALPPTAGSFFSSII
jgi:hypothetical protein